MTSNWQLTYVHVDGHMPAISLYTANTLDQPAMKEFFKVSSMPSIHCKT